MRTIEGLDLEAILAPISEEAPVGEPLDTDDPSSGYYRVKDTWSKAKNVERMNERNRSIGEQTETANWGGVISEAERILTTQSKDFRVACWLGDALLRNYGFSGLRFAMKLCRGMCENYWDSMYPPPSEEEGHSDRVTQFGALTSEGNVIALNSVPLTDTGGEIEFTGSTYLQAGELGKLSEQERESRLRSGAVTYDQFKQAVDNTPVEFHIQTIDDLASALEDLNVLSRFFDEHCQPDSYGESTAPGVTAFRDQMESLLRLISSLTAERRQAAAPVEEEAAGPNELITTASGVAVSSEQPTRLMKMSDGEPTNREDALAALQKVAEFFAKTEPHSLISFKIKQAVQWARMPLPELLGELIKDANVMHQISQRTGLPESGSDD